MHSNRFLNAAISIGDQLLRSAKHGTHGITWNTMVMDPDQKIALQESETLYSGVSGIALFLVELYKQTGDEKYILTAQEALAWVEWHCNAHSATKNYGFLTGRMGVAYTLLQIYNTTNEEKYLHKALAIAKPCQDALQTNQLKEYISGNSGTLLGLLHLHAASRQPWLLEAIDRYVQIIIQTTRLSSKGIYWDTSPYVIRPLCGFSHGVSGVGFVLNELGRYLNNPTFNVVAEQAFAYENAYFDSKTGNWQDFRLNIWKEDQIAEMEEAYKAGRLGIFNRTSDASAWCHGAPGIGLTRMRAHELSGKKALLQDAQRALHRVRQTELGHTHDDTFTLCHGLGGNADTLLEGYTRFGDLQDLRQAQQWGDAAIKQRKQLGWYLPGLGTASSGTHEDLSLLNGIAGIGYFYLRLHDSKKVLSVLAPKLAAKPLAVIPKNLLFLSMKSVEVQKHLVKNAFPASIDLAEKYAPQYTEGKFKRIGAQSSLREFFVQLMQDMPKVMPVKQKQHMTEAFSLEKLKMELEDQRPSNGLLYIEERLLYPQKVKLLRSSDTILLRSTLELTKYSRLFAVKKGEYLLLKLTIPEVEEQKIGQFCYAVLRTFAKKSKVSRAVDMIAHLYGMQDEAKKKIVEEKVLSQVRVALAYGALMSHLD